MPQLQKPVNDYEKRITKDKEDHLFPVFFLFQLGVTHMSIQRYEICTQMYDVMHTLLSYCFHTGYFTGRLVILFATCNIYNITRIYDLK